MHDERKTALAAQGFVKRFGKEAPAEARRRADELRNAGKLESSATWTAIYDEVEALVKSGFDEINR